jgi:hypothetical protein
MAGDKQQWWAKSDTDKKLLGGKPEGGIKSR